MPKPDRRRAQTAEDIRKLSEAMGSLATRARWAVRDVRDDRAEDIRIGAAEAAELLFALAQDIASGRVELDGPDSPRPLFDRPKAGGESVDPTPIPGMVATRPALFSPLAAEMIASMTEVCDAAEKLISPTAVRMWPSSSDLPMPAEPGYPPGTRVSVCNRCNVARLRTGTTTVCLSCRCPEYSLAVVLEDGTLGPDKLTLAEQDAAEEARRKKPRKRKEAAVVAD